MYVDGYMIYVLIDSWMDGWIDGHACATYFIFHCVKDSVLAIDIDCIDNNIDNSSNSSSISSSSSSNNN